jgi:hypothetical protein
MAAIMISVDGINCENLSCNKRGVHIWVDKPSISGKLLGFRYRFNPVTCLMGADIRCSNSGTRYIKRNVGRRYGSFFYQRSGLCFPV